MNVLQLLLDYHDLNICSSQIKTMHIKDKRLTKAPLYTCKLKSIYTYNIQNTRINMI